MTLLGKIFTFLIFVMSMCFMMIAVAVYATHKNWKEEIVRSDKTNPGLKQQIVDMRAKNKVMEEKLQIAKNELAQEKVARAAALAVLENARIEKEIALKAKSDELAKVLAAHGEATADLQTKTQLLEKVTGEVGGLRTDIVSVQNQNIKYFGDVTGLTNQIHQAKGVSTRLEATNKTLSSDLVLMKQALQVIGKTPQEVVNSGVPVLDGVVTAVDNDKKQVEVSLGMDVGLKIGHQLEMYRENEYLGRIQIRKSTSDRAVGEGVPGYWKGEVRKGDRVYTKVS